MNYQSARIFLSVVELGSFSAAASALYLSRPAVSSYLSRLEEELGVRLFVRQRGVQKVTLTPEGTNFIPVAKKLLQGEKLLQEFKDACNQKTLRIGAAHATHEYMIAPIAEKLQQKLPQVDLQLYIIPTGTANDMNSPSHYDIAIRFYYWGYGTSTSLFTNIPFFQDPSYVLCPAETPLPDRCLCPEDLDPNFQIRRAIMTENTAVWYQQHFPDCGISHAPSVMNMLNIPRCFKDPRCWALVPASIVGYLTAEHPGELTYRPIIPAPPPRSGNIIVSKSYYRQDVIDTFLCCCREYLEERPYLKSLLSDNG